MEVYIWNALLNELTEQRRLYSKAVLSGDDLLIKTHEKQIEELKARISHYNPQRKGESTMKNLREMTKKELEQIAKEMKISNWWNMKKGALIEKIEEIQSMTPAEKKAADDQKAKEDEALANYQKDWRKYTKTYNPIEFMEKLRAGKITLGADEQEKQAGPVEKKKPAPKKAEAQKPAAAPTAAPGRGALIEFDGEAKNICAWAEELGISANTLYGRIYKLGWTVEKAFTTPAKKK